MPLRRKKTTLPRRQSGLTRRDLLIASGAAAIGVGGTLVAKPVIDELAASNASETAAESDTTAADLTRRYVSTQATMSSFTVERRDGAALAPGLLFSAVNMETHRGVIFDNAGEPIWIDPTGADIYNLRVQEYQGQPVLTYTSGQLVDGYGVGTGSILNQHYDVIATIRAANGLAADLHELLITTQGTALITAYPTVQGDLRAVGGTKDGWYIDPHVQEIDIATGDLLLNWRSSDHLSIGESYQPLGSSGTTASSPYDPFHLNAVAVADGNDRRLLISARHTHALYAIDRASGELQWRLNGKKSDFKLEDEAGFAWQHHITTQSPTQFTVFDNHVKSTAGSSRGLVLTVDEESKTVRHRASFTHDARRGTAMGSTQRLDNGNTLVGWGTGKALTEFDAAGTALLDIRFPGASYRSFRASWVGSPSTRPSIAGRERSDGTTDLYASWNGSTETQTWLFEYGLAADALSGSHEVTRTGFETTLNVPQAKYAKASSLDSAGRVLGSSVTSRI